MYYSTNTDLSADNKNKVLPSQQEDELINALENYDLKKLRIILSEYSLMKSNTSIACSAQGQHFQKAKPYKDYLKLMFTNVDTPELIYEILAAGFPAIDLLFGFKDLNNKKGLEILVSILQHIDGIKVNEDGMIIENEDDNILNLMSTILKDTGAKPKSNKITNTTIKTRNLEREKPKLDQAEIIKLHNKISRLYKLSKNTSELLTQKQIFIITAALSIILLIADISIFATDQIAKKTNEDALDTCSKYEEFEKNLFLIWIFSIVLCFFDYAHLHHISEQQNKIVSKINSNELNKTYCSGKLTHEIISQQISIIKQQLHNNYDYQKGSISLQDNIRNRFSKEYANQSSPPLRFWKHAFDKKSFSEEQELDSKSLPSNRLQH